MSDLKACPFCGSAAKLSRIISHEGELRGERPSFDVDCSGCGLWRRFDTEPDAVEAWNLRAEPVAEPAAWRCEDLILGGVSIIDDAAHAAQRAARPEWRVTPLFTAGGAPETDPA